MKGRMSSIILIILSIVLGLLYMITSTYSVIIEATEEDGVIEILNQITIRDLLTKNTGEYNQTYYDVLNELDIDKEEAEVLIDSRELNYNLQIVLNSIVNYRAKNNENAKLSNDQLYSLILDGVNGTDNISPVTRDKILDKASIYMNDISEFLYDIEVSFFKEK